MSQKIDPAGLGLIKTRWEFGVREIWDLGVFKKYWTKVFLMRSHAFYPYSPLNPPQVYSQDRYGVTVSNMQI